MVDLNKAWIIKCVKAIISEFKEIANIIMAICLKVDKAIIFLRSCSQLADNLAYVAVDLEINSNNIVVVGWLKENMRSIRNTPAVTRVDEWTKAEIGVGAAIAIGSQAENGNCALFEHAAIIKSNMVRFIYSIFI